MSMKNSNNTIGNPTCDLPACSAVPRPTAPPRAAFVVCDTEKFLTPNWFSAHSLIFTERVTSWKLMMVLFSFLAFCNEER